MPNPFIKETRMTSVDIPERAITGETFQAKVNFAEVGGPEDIVGKTAFDVAIKEVYTDIKSAKVKADAAMPKTGGRFTGKVEVTGNIEASGAVIGGQTFSSSDSRLKSDISRITNGLETILKLNGYSFIMNESGFRSAGVIAQELEKIQPDLVHKRSDDMLTVDYVALQGYMIEAIKQLYNDITKIKIKLGV